MITYIGFGDAMRIGMKVSEEKVEQQVALAIFASLLGLIALSLILIYLGHIPPKSVAMWSFIAVIAGSLVLSWAVETAEFMVSQGFAVAIVALLQVMPEFMVEGVIAYEGKIDLMTANLTGSNRLLMGVGWSLIFFTAFFFNHRKGGLSFSIKIKRENIIEPIFLILSSIYFIVILLKRRLWIEDTVILALMFIAYMWILLRLPPEEEEKRSLLPLPPRVLSIVEPIKLRVFLVILLFICGGITMVLVAHPFLEGMEAVALSIGISSFVFVQWVAPFLTEFPEKITAFYWAKTVHSANMAMINMVSSKVNQWTLLVAMVPLVFWFSPKGGEPIHLSEHQLEELFLSMVMSVYGAVCLMKGRFTLENALWLFSLWFVQFVSPGRFVPPHDTYFDFPFWMFESWRGLTSLGFMILIPYEVFRFRNEFHVISDMKFTLDLISKGSRP